MYRYFFSTRRGEVPLDSLTKVINNTLGIHFETILQEWDSKELPCFQVKDFKVEQLVQNNKSREFFGSFLIQNRSNRTESVLYGFGTKKYSLTLEAGESKRVRVRSYNKKFWLNLGISRNFPPLICFSSRLNKYPFTRDTIVGIWNAPLADWENKENEIIVDNENPDSRLIIPQEKWLRTSFRKLFGISNNASNHWKKEYAHYHYGNQLHHSAYVKNRGKGLFQAERKAQIQQEGEYEIFVWNSFNYPLKQKQHYIVKGEGMEPEEVVCAYDIADLWISLGRFHLNAGTSIVTLDDRFEEGWGKRRSKVTADVVRWVKIK